jgi:hypothetical protein
LPHYGTKPSVGAELVPQPVKVTNKSKILASANIKEMRDTKHEKLEEELSIHIKQLNDGKEKATYDVINVSTVHYYFIKYSTDVF